jgi:hypothetical protein
MKTTTGIPLNVTMEESFLRLMLIVPAGMLAVTGIVLMHTYLLVLLPFYLLATGLTSYSPLKHLYRVMMHKPVFTAINDPVLSSDLM